MVDFQDGLLDDEDVLGINIRKNPPPPGRQLSLEEAKDVLRKLDAAFKANDDYMREYFKIQKQTVGGDLAAGMNIIRPVGFEIQQNALPELGYENSYVGLVQCASAIRVHVKDWDILKLKKKLAENFVPHHFRQEIPEGYVYGQEMEEEEKEEKNEESKA